MVIIFCLFILLKKNFMLSPFLVEAAFTLRFYYIFDDTGLICH